MAAFPMYRGSKHVPVEVRSDFINTSCFESVALSTPGLEKGCTLGKVTYTSAKSKSIIRSAGILVERRVPGA